MFRLGLNRKLATMLGKMTLTQVVHIANAGHVIFNFRLDETILAQAIAPSNIPGNMQQAHVAIMLAKQSAETLELAEAA